VEILTKKKRLSSKIKTEMVLNVLRGESMDEISRKYGVTVAQLSDWRDSFIANGTNGFKKKPENSRVLELERMVGKQQMKIELLKKNEISHT